MPSRVDEASRLQDQLARATAVFTARFGRPPTVAAAAPGRVNLIGEHTDYNAGFVLPIAIERQTLIAAAPRTDAQIHIISTNVQGEASFPVAIDLARGTPAWANYVRGVVVQCLKRNIDVPGFDAVIDSTVPTGGGLSSSAALEVAVATLIEQLTGHTLDPVDKARLAQQTEHDFAGTPCGIMDPFIATLAQPGTALLIDCRTNTGRPVRLADPSVALLIANSHVAHELGDGAYAERRRQCEAAAAVLGVPALRDATPAQVDAARDALGDPGYRRARHVVTENERTLAMAAAMEAGDWAQAGQLMLQSHASLRDDFEVSCPELDVLVELAGKHIQRGEVYGSRMTGGGFGGCTITLVRAAAVDAVTAALTAGYTQATGITPTLFATRPAGGTRGGAISDF